MVALLVRSTTSAAADADVARRKPCFYDKGNATAIDLRRLGEHSLTVYLRLRRSLSVPAASLDRGHQSAPTMACQKG